MACLMYRNVVGQPYHRSIYGILTLVILSNTDFMCVRDVNETRAFEAET